MQDMYGNTEEIYSKFQFKVHRDVWYSIELYGWYLLSEDYLFLFTLQVFKINYKLCSNTFNCNVCVLCSEELYAFGKGVSINVQ